MDRQDRRPLVLVMALLALLTLAFKPYICRFRNGHQPDENDVSAFLNRGDEKSQTRCVTCECDLELCGDPEDPDLYWVVEI